MLALASIYAVLASIEAGIALTMVLPRLTNNSIASSRIYTPIWEITNVFLVIATTIMSLIFNNVLPHLSHIAFVPLFFAGASLLTRAICGMYIFYSHNKVGLLPRLLLILSSYLAPLSIAVIGIDFFTGKSVWSSSPGIVLISSALLGITVIGLAFNNRHKLAISQSVRYVLYALFALWAIDLGFMLPHSLMKFDNTLLRTPLTILIAAIAISTISFFMYSAVKNKLYELYQYVILIGLITPIFLGIDLRPYLINHVITIKHAYGAAAYQSSIVVGAIISLPILAIGFYLLFKLLVEETRSEA
jgi:cytochrome bd-type quinol oxidase subunit 2